MPTDKADKGDRVLYIQFKNYNADAFEYVSLYKYLFMWMDYTLMMYGTCDGLIVVLDSKGLSWRHIMKLPLGITTKMLKFLEVSERCHRFGSLDQCSSISESLFNYGSRFFIKFKKLRFLHEKLRITSN